MIIEIDNVWARIVDGEPRERAWVYDFLSCTVDQWNASLNYTDTVRLSMVDNVSGAFPTGLIPAVQRGAAQAGIAVIVQDNRRVPVHDPNADIAWLRDYQKAAVCAVTPRRPRGLIKVPTGGGKTEIFVALTRMFPCEWLFVVHRSSILGEAASRYSKRTGERAGTFEAGQWKRGTCNVTVASFQTLYKGVTRGDPATLDFLRQVEGVNVDECHSQSASSFYQVLQSMPNAYYRIGQSGTPLDRDDWENLRVIGALGPILYKVPRQVLVDAGVLSTATVRMVECRQLCPATQWREIYERMIVHSKKRNALLAHIALRARKPCFLFVDETRHGEAVVAQLKRLGVNVSEVYGDKQASARERAVRELVNGNTEVLVCTSVFQEGIDVPSLKSVINGQGKKSIIQVLQRIGRGMRVCGDGDNTFDVWDVADLCHRVLERHAHKRLGTYQNDGHEVESGSFADFFKV